MKQTRRGIVALGATSALALLTKTDASPNRRIEKRTEHRVDIADDVNAYLKLTSDGFVGKGVLFSGNKRYQAPVTVQVANQLSEAITMQIDAYTEDDGTVAVHPRKLSVEVGRESTFDITVTAGDPSGQLTGIVELVAITESDELIIEAERDLELKTDADDENDDEESADQEPEDETEDEDEFEESEDDEDDEGDNGSESEDEDNTDCLTKSGERQINCFREKYS